MQALLLLKSEAEIGQGQALQSFNKQHWQNVAITILISITVFFFYIGISTQASLHTFSCLPQLKQSPSTEFLAPAANSHLHCGLLTARVTSLSHPQNFVLTYYHTNDMSLKCGCNFSARRCWCKRQFHAWKKNKGNCEMASSLENLNLSPRWWIIHKIIFIGILNTSFSYLFLHYLCYLFNQWLLHISVCFLKCLLMTLLTSLFLSVTPGFCFLCGELMTAISSVPWQHKILPKGFFKHKGEEDWLKQMQLI